jgi:hypothetical protein
VGELKKYRNVENMMAGKNFYNQNIHFHQLAATKHTKNIRIFLKTNMTCAHKARLLR